MLCGAGLEAGDEGVVGDWDWTEVAAVRGGF